MLEILGQNRGKREEEDDFFASDPELAELSSKRLRIRSFLKSLAYLCDFESRGRRTTAIALEQKRAGIVFWFASNVYPRARDPDKMKVFLEVVLMRLKHTTSKNAPSLEETLFTKAVRFSEEKITQYVRRLTTDIRDVLENYEAWNLPKGIVNLASAL